MPEPKFTRGWPNATHRFLALFSIYILNTDLVALDRFNNSGRLPHALSERKKSTGIHLWEKLVETKDEVSVSLENRLNSLDHSFRVNSDQEEMSSFLNFHHKLPRRPWSA